MKAISLIMLALITPVQAQQVTYSNQYGQVVGYLSSKDGVATYSNSYGQVVGYAAPQPQMLPTSYESATHYVLPPVPDLYKLPELPSLPLIQLQPILQ